MSGLLDEIHEQMSVTTRTRCIVHRISEMLDKDDVADFHRAVDDESINAQAIARALAARGIMVKGERIRVHRRGQCGCARG